MSSLLMLLLFCDFLENRLQTSSLALLRRIFSDFFAGNERTLLDFVRLGASIVTVMPMERTSASHRQEAARLLNQQVQLMVNYNEQHLQLSVFHYLSVRVATKNISWLRSMFLEFCGGNDSLLRQFVRRGNEVISVIPVDNQALPRQPMSVEMNPPVFPSMPTPHLMRPQALQEEQNQQYQCSEPGEDESDSDDDNEINNVNELVSVASMPPSPDNMRTCIVGILESQEEKEPWKQVFSPDALSPPFSSVKHPKLAAALKQFWTEHARAVWERRFWGPLRGMRAGSPHAARKARQAKARRAFEGVMIHVFKELGASFFVKLDRRTKPHSGWWYVEPTQNLVLIAQCTGLATCLNYVESQALERFPSIPGGGIGSKKSNSGKSRSMWSARTSMKRILSEICAIATANNKSKTKSRK
ncbi:uncharacterized protein KRP23_13842 [Phytophthora ramorum]|uniref:uncharacterized protein n=1 Tax=Phytophthora ramorum TaxID=164328 RepID=UPI0030AE3D3F|nr:hypothetical protein KRP23_13842 [Phytophthora ramorum]